jgi:pSer/pThr/pTyr-binding forkhead associated (FHA) protein
LPSVTGVDVVDAIITIGTDLSASVRRESSTSIITVNGVVLGIQPSPLFHGDHIAIDGVPLVYGDEAHAGMTAKVAAISSGAERPSSAPSPRRAKTGGRLVSLMDGREYTVRADGLTIGREAGCDIVVAASEVSRRHARVELRPEGYAVVDMSTNGVMVNGVRIKRAQSLSRGDTIRVGPEEFRFHADAEVTVEPPPPPIILATPALPHLVEEEAAPRKAAEEGGARAAVEASAPYPGGMAPAPQQAAPPGNAVAAPASPRGETIATLEVMTEGPSKGKRFEIGSPLVHVGHGAHNDIVLSEESVSDSHAKLQRRETGWFVVDMNSTNGTYVAGQRVRGAAPLSSGTDVRFGSARLRFTSVSFPLGEGRASPPIAGARQGTPRMQGVIEPEEPDFPSPIAPTEEPGMPRYLLGAILLVALVVVYLILRSV